MNKIIEIESLNGLLVETKFKTTVQQTSAETKFEQVGGVLERGFSSINKLSTSFYENVVKNNPNISSVTLEFGFSLTGTGNVYIVEAGVEASFKVNITFEKQPEPGGTPS
jgi:hypothetical protein